MFISDYRAGIDGVFCPCAFASAGRLSFLLFLFLSLFFVWVGNGLFWSRKGSLFLHIRSDSFDVVLQITYARIFLDCASIDLYGISKIV